MDSNELLERLTRLGYDLTDRGNATDHMPTRRYWEGCADTVAAAAEHVRGQAAPTHERYVLHSKTLGVYLGEFANLGCWSKLDPAGQSKVPVWPSPFEVRLYVNAFDPVPDMGEWGAVKVTCAKPDEATVDECVAAGLLRWNP